MTTAVNLVRGFRHLRALVIGDAMLDTYLEGTATRLCREGPVPVVRKTAELYVPGGAANTAANLRALDADVVFLHHFRDVGATVITPNHLEAQLLVEYMPDTSLGVPRPGALARETDTSLSEVERIGRHLLTIIDAEHAAITMAGDGVLLIDRRGRTLHIPTHPVLQATDVGAGDSFAAAMALALAAGGSVEESARIALDAASIAVTKRWTAVVHYQELLQRVSLRDHARHSRSLSSLSEARAPEALSQLMTQLDAQRLRGRTLVFTNGVFDILHAGHIQFLRQAKALGDVLVVGINSDRGTKRIKGKNRPINSEQDRMALVAALDAVDHVILFDEDAPTTLIRMLRPHIHVKGGDYADEVLPEAEAVREVGGRIVILPLAGSISTSSVIDRIIALAADERIEVEQ